MINVIMNRQQMYFEGKCREYLLSNNPGKTIEEKEKVIKAVDNAKFAFNEEDQTVSIMYSERTFRIPYNFIFKDEINKQ